MNIIEKIVGELIGKNPFLFPMEFMIGIGRLGTHFMAT